MKNFFWAAAVLLACGGCALFCDVAEFEELEKPKVCFKICEGDEIEAVYAYCNLHSLWKA